MHQLEALEHREVTTDDPKDLREHGATQAYEVVIAASGESSRRRLGEHLLERDDIRIECCEFCAEVSQLPLEICAALEFSTFHVVTTIPAMAGHRRVP